MQNITHISTNAQNITISRYTAPFGYGYLVTVPADGETSVYDFQDSFELALEYRAALVEAWDSWSMAACQAEASGNRDELWHDADLLWKGFLMLAHNAKYPKIQPKPVVVMSDMLAALVKQHEAAIENWQFEDAYIHSHPANGWGL